MIYIYRFLWLLFYIPIFFIELIMFSLMLLTLPIIGIFYFIKDGHLENTPYQIINPIMYVDVKYKELLDKIEKK